MPYESILNYGTIDDNNLKEETYLHLILPADQVHFVNENGVSIIGPDEYEDSNLYIEFGCRVFEVNRIHQTKGEDRSIETN
mmetsp:Transcript_32379/g.31676  ORF Transcript_32379/g.31676 Transcript_32379/m.31676 type:complete len:81 (+) Transcript_32379:478-720(+)